MYQLNPGRHGPLRIGERVSIILGALVVIIAFASVIAHADVPVGADGVAPSAPAPVSVSVDASGGSKISDGVWSAFNTFLVTLLTALVTAIGLGLWWFRGWIKVQAQIQERKALRDMAMADSQAAQTRLLGALSGSKEAAAEMEAKAVAVERSKVLHIPPGALPPEK